MENVTRRITNSVNDISYKRVLKTLAYGIEKPTLTDKNHRLMIASNINVPINNDLSKPFNTNTNDDPQIDVDNRADGQDKDNPLHTIISDSMHWTRQTDGKWQPPSTKITKMSDNNDIAFLAQSDSGANRIVTNSLNDLQDVTQIDPIIMGSCNKNDPAALTCTAMGKLPIQSMTGEIILATAYYSSEVDGTIISPTTIVSQFKERFVGWMQYSNCDTDTGDITLIGRNGDDVRFATKSINDLWYHAKETIGITTGPKINKLNSAAKYELWHQRTGHAGATTLESLHKHAEGVPKLHGNAFYRCPSCMSGKLCTKRSIGKKKKVQEQPGKNIDSPTDTIQHEPDDMHIPNAAPGQHFHMDFGFVRGSDFNYKTKTGRTITSIDGKSAYLAVIDRASRYTWIFITESKQPPVTIVQKLLEKFKSTNPHRTVRVDQGGELGKSAAFRNMIGTSGFSLEITGSDASAQNGMVENPNRMFGQMMRCMLHSAELGPEYWSYALLHAVYIKNRLPHHSLHKSPFEVFTGNQPDLSNLRIFGSRLYARKPGRRPFKLDHHTSGGYFLGFTATGKNVQYIDEKSGRVKTSTHVILSLLLGWMQQKVEGTLLSVQ